MVEELKDSLPPSGRHLLNCSKLIKKNNVSRDLFQKAYNDTEVHGFKMPIEISKEHLEVLVSKEGLCPFFTALSPVASWAWQLRGSPNPSQQPFHNLTLSQPTTSFLYIGRTQIGWPANGPSVSNTPRWWLRYPV